MTTEYAHLHPSVGALADEPDAIHIGRVGTDRWIGYGQAERALAALEDLLAFQSACACRICCWWVDQQRQDHDHREVFDARIRIVRRPQRRPELPKSRYCPCKCLPPRTSFASSPPCWVRSARQIGRRPPRRQTGPCHAASARHSGTHPHHRRGPQPALWRREPAATFPECGGSAMKLQIPLVAVGRPEVLRAMQSDDQLANRFSPFPLTLWATVKCIGGC